MHRRIFVIIVTPVLSLALIASSADGRQTKTRVKGNKQEAITKLRRAADFIAREDLASAEVELDSILKNNLQEPRALNLLGVVRTKQNRAGEAEELFKRALASAPRMAEAHANLGLLYMSAERVEEAAKQFEKALQGEGSVVARANLITALRRIASTSLASGENEKALAHLLRAKAIAPDDGDILFEFGMVAMKLSLYEDAEAALAAALEKRPAEPKFIYALARARMETGKLPESERLFRRYVPLRPQDATGYYGLGLVLYRLKQNLEAAKCFEQSLKLHPEQTESQYQLGMIAQADGNLDAAATHFEKVLSRFADHVGALLGMGLVHAQRKQYELARQTLERVVALQPDLAKAHYQLGLTYARLGNKEAAMRETELATKLEREQKQARRIVLRLLEKGRDAPPQNGEKP